MKDANGNDLQIGDAILIPATVSAFDGDGMLRAKLIHHNPKDPKDKMEYRFEAAHVVAASPVETAPITELESTPPEPEEPTQEEASSAT